jgi:hypothetical protein
VQQGEIPLLELEPAPIPVEPLESDWHDFLGEAPDNGAVNSLQLTHRVVARFPDLNKRYRSFVGSAAVSSAALLGLASIAISLRLQHGESPEKILLEITSEEIENATGRVSGASRRRRS